MANQPIMTLKAIIFDFGGVLLRTHTRSYRTAWDDKLGLAHGQFEDYIFNGSVGSLAQLGQATWSDIWPQAAEYFGLTSAEIQQAQADFFKGDSLDQDLADYIRRLKTHYTIGLLSNTWYPSGEALLRSYNLTDAFDVWVTSAEIGVMKPDYQIYQVALERTASQPQETIFVDDFAHNIEAAQALGLQTVHYRDPIAARQALIALTGVE